MDISLDDLEFLERTMETGLRVVAVIHIALVVLMTWIVWLHTSPEMAVLRYTVSSAMCWVTLAVLYFAFCFRPVLLTPLPLAVVRGFIADYASSSAQWGIYVGLSLVMNVTMAMTLCLTTQFTALVAPLFRHRLTYGRGVVIFVSCHTAATALCACLATYLQRSPLSVEELNGAFISANPNLSAYLRNRTIVGLHHAQDSRFLAAFIFVWFTLCATAWVSLFVGMLRAILLKKKSTADKNHHGRYAHMAMILMARAIAPLICLAIPGIACTVVAFWKPTHASEIITALSLVAASTGVVTLGLVKMLVTPYRRALFRLLRLHKLWSAVQARKVGTTLRSDMHRHSSAGISTLDAIHANLERIRPQ